MWTTRKAALGGPKPACIRSQKMLGPHLSASRLWGDPGQSSAGGFWQRHQRVQSRELVPPERFGCPLARHIGLSHLKERKSERSRVPSVVGGKLGGAYQPRCGGGPEFYKQRFSDRALLEQSDFFESDFCKLSLNRGSIMGTQGLGEDVYCPIDRGVSSFLIQHRRGRTRKSHGKPGGDLGHPGVSGHPIKSGFELV